MSGMARYKRMKTTLGHRYWMRMDDREIAERLIYRIAIVGLPLISAAGFFLIWVKGIRI